MSHEQQNNKVKETPFICQYCGAKSWLDPADQSPPADYCHESDHGSEDEFIAADDA